MLKLFTVFTIVLVAQQIWVELLAAIGVKANPDEESQAQVIAMLPLDVSVIVELYPVVQTHSPLL